MESAITEKEIITAAFSTSFFLRTSTSLVIGLIGSIVAQVGDIFASSIKRKMKIKDYGKLIPGHGGVLDRFDSVIFVAPFLYMMFRLWPIVG